MMFSKLFFVLPALLGAANSQPPPPGAFMGCGDGEAPIALACDTDPWSTTIPMKNTQILQDYGLTVTASIECQGTASAFVCIGVEEDGGIGITIAGDDDSIESFENPKCVTIFYLEEGVKKYKSICRGRDFKITQTLHIRGNWEPYEGPGPVRHLQAKGSKGTGTLATKGSKSISKGAKRARDLHQTKGAKGWKGTDSF